MIHLTLRTQFSFRQTFMHMNRIPDFAVDGIVGVADIGNTFAHPELERLKSDKIQKRIYGVRLEVLSRVVDKERGLSGPTYIFIAKSEKGLQEINNLVTKSYENFYYKPRVGLADVAMLSEEVFIIPESLESLDDHRIDYIALTPSTPQMIADLDFPKVYCDDNYFPTPSERSIYQLMAGSQKRGDEYMYKFNTKRAFQHILTEEEFNRIWNCPEAAENTYKIAAECDVKIPRAEMVRYKGKAKIETVCERRAKSKGIDLSTGIYAERYARELKLIKEKEYTDYFMVVWEMVKKAKQKMLVGPGRGSSGGSLVCYLMGITEIDPIKFGLVFERFIDINRDDLPDIDIDFPDEYRGEVVKDLFKTHGKENVCHIANVNLFKARSAIDDVAISLRIPKFETDLLKDSIVDRTGGDARAAISIQDTLETTEIGKEFVEKYPAIVSAQEIQGHATHSGKHAAGVVVCNDEITKYGAVNVRDGCVMMDKKSAEYLNLLKIDALGLRTLTILQECAEIVGMEFKDYYSLPLNDEKAYQIFSQKRLNGIFQFEGQAMKMLCEKMDVENFNDIVAITALARPGPLHSGGAEKFAKRRTGREETVYISNNEKFIDATKDTYGIIVYQEQLMILCRDCGNMDWADVSAIRKAASKTMGKEFFERYREKFLNGAAENDITADEANDMWDNMMTFGSWGMNKSHTVAYGYISYWCAYMKANHPLAFTAANLRHAKSPASALQILRDAYENDGVDYVPVDPDLSEENWAIKDGKLMGGLSNIKGVGDKKAKEIIKAREGKGKWTPSMVRMLSEPVTDFDILYPCKHYWGDIFENPRDYGLAFPPHLIRDIQDSGVYVAIGQVIRKDVRDLNEYNELVKRGGKRYPDGENLSLKLTIMDDTGQINCSVNRFKYDKLNCKKLADTLVVDKSWVIVKGQVNEGWKVIQIDQIFDLAELGE